MPAAPGTFIVPAAALAYLLPGSAQFQVNAGNSNGGIVAAEASKGLNANIPLVTSGQFDFGGFAAFLTIIQSATIQ